MGPRPADLDNFTGKRTRTAHGGCLGCGWDDEGRGTPRKASGSGVARRDPRVTEWGNLPAQGPGRVRRERIRVQSGELKHLSTRVEKASANPVVAASEPGRVQTVQSDHRTYRALGRVAGLSRRRMSAVSGGRRWYVKLLECSAPAGESPVASHCRSCDRIQSTPIHVEDWGKPGGPPSKTPDHPSPIAYSTVRER